MYPYGITMGLADSDRKELESLIKAAVRDPKVPIGLARRMVPTQGNIEDFAYGLVSGMVIGNFIALFQGKNGRQPDKDEIADLFSIMMVRMPRLRMSIMKEFDMR
ncbi:MAG TPA: hypothetical protein VHL10_08700 [Nitrososphaera sp.]|nr:hypothetical protein [Nitrososphaera sp.]